MEILSFEWWPLKNFPILPEQGLPNILWQDSLIPVAQVSVSVMAESQLNKVLWSEIRIYQNFEL